MIFGPRRQVRFSFQLKSYVESDDKQNLQLWNPLKILIYKQGLNSVLNLICFRQKQVILLSLDKLYPFFIPLRLILKGCVLNVCKIHMTPRMCSAHVDMTQDVQCLHMETWNRMCSAHASASVRSRYLFFHRLPVLCSLSKMAKLPAIAPAPAPSK